MQGGGSSAVTSPPYRSPTQRKLAETLQIKQTFHLSGRHKVSIYAADTLLINKEAVIWAGQASALNRLKKKKFSAEEWFLKIALEQNVGSFLLSSPAWSSTRC